MRSWNSDYTHLRSLPKVRTSRGLHGAICWGVPAVLAIGAGETYGNSLISLTATGTLWVIAVAWAGTGCLINGRSCGRVHCRVDEIVFPLLAIVGALNVLSIISFSWNLFWLALVVILVGSFVPEWTWRKYSRSGHMAGADDVRNYPG